MKLEDFVNNNTKTWESLNTTLKKIKSKGYKSLDSAELHNLYTNYNIVCWNLSYSQTYFPNTDTTAYLNNLTTIAHGYIYTTKTSYFQNVLNFYLVKFPYLIRKHYKVILVSSIIFLISTIFSYFMTAINNEFASAFIPKELVKSINFNNDKMWNQTIASTSIFTNNIKVGFSTFATGITFGIGTIYILATNGYMLGSIGGLAYNQNITYKFWSLILPHGFIELFCIFICSGAGLLIGYSLISPGKYTRKTSLILSSKISIQLVLGSIPLFIIAGLIEGYFTPLQIDPIYKYIFAFSTIIFIIFYIILGNILHSKRSLHN